MALKFLVVYEINLKVYNLVSPIPSQCQGRVTLPKQMDFFGKAAKWRWGGVIFNPNVYVANFGP